MARKKKNRVQTARQKASAPLKVQAESKPLSFLMENLQEPALSVTNLSPNNIGAAKIENRNMFSGTGTNQLTYRINSANTMTAVAQENDKDTLRLNNDSHVTGHLN